MAHEKICNNGPCEHIIKGVIRDTFGKIRERNVDRCEISGKTVDEMYDHIYKVGCASHKGAYD
jgi:hypothetical protein